MKVLFFFLIVLTATALADTQTDIEYAKVGEVSLKLDLHRPPGENPPLLVYVHGGGWRAGSKEDVPVVDLYDKGYAIASVDYRLSTQAPFPAQVHDIKAAIRFLRANAGKYHVNAGKIAILGSSAGGHLAALVGVSNGSKELEGKVGEHLDQSSDVQVIVSYFGASNLETILAQSTPKGLEFRIPALKLLLGDTPDKKPELARLASPVAHLDKKDPPLLLIHGDADPQMPPQQSQELAKAYEALGLPVTLIVMPGSRHGGAEFYDEERTAIVTKFLDKVLR
ncbi:alpha/beta fold hydrolase [Prosthecobacter sp.]|uniref:alpha/beta fold hydrolase n=1 Tax=Prosthecobacter sp. TaxID=1965333 RepID=UPI003784AC4E